MNKFRSLVLVLCSFFTFAFALSCQNTLFKGKSKGDKHQPPPTPVEPVCDPKVQDCEKKPVPPPPPVDPCDPKNPTQQASKGKGKDDSCHPQPFYSCKKNPDGVTDYYPIKAQVYYFGPDTSISTGANYAPKVAEDYASERKFLQKYFGEITSSRPPVVEICMLNFAVTPRDFSEGFPGVNDNLRSKFFEWFTFEAVTKIVIPKDGNYQFKVRSDDGSILTINNGPIIVHDGQHDPQYKEGSVFLTKGEHNLSMKYFQGPRFKIALELYWKAQGAADFEIVPPSAFKPR